MQAVELEGGAGDRDRTDDIQLGKLDVSEYSQDLACKTDGFGTTADQRVSRETQNQIPSIGHTQRLVVQLFDGILDKGSKPYVDHCCRVAARLPTSVSVDAVHAAFLHDVVEDTSMTIEGLRDLGYSERTLWLVDRLTRKPEDGTYMDYIRGIAATGDADLTAIKLADLADNSDPVRLAQIDGAARISLAIRYKIARQSLEAARPLPLSDMGRNAG